MHYMRNRSCPLWVYAIPLIAAFMLPNLITPLMEILRSEIGFSSGELTVVFVCYLGGLAPAFLLAPSLGRIWGRRRIQLISCGLGIASCLFYIAATSVGILLIARVLTGLCSGLILVLGPSAVQAIAKQDQVKQATFVATLGIAVGLAGGPIFAGIVAELLPWPTKTVFALMAILLALSSLVILTEEETPAEPVNSWLPFKGLEAKTGRAIAAGLGAFGPGMTAAAIILALAPTLLHGLGGTTGPLGAGLMAGGMYVMSPVAQTIVRRFGSMVHIRIALVLIVLAMAVFAIAVNSHYLTLLVLSAALMGAGQGISNLGSFGLIHQIVPPTQAPGATAILSLGVYASASIVPLAGGFLIDAQGLERSALYMALGVAAMAIFGSLLARKKFIGQPRSY